MNEGIRAGEVIEARTTEFQAQCYELYQSPPLGSLVKVMWESNQDCQDFILGVVYDVHIAGLDPGRRAIARGKEETREEDVYKANPQLLKLLKSEFKVLVIGCRKNGHYYQYLPPNPARIHGFVYRCSPEEIQEFSRNFDFLHILLKSRLDIPVEELTAAALRQMSQVYGLAKQAFLISAGKELATLLSADYGQLKAILKGLKYDAT